MRRSLFDDQRLRNRARYGNWPRSLVILVAGLALTIVATLWLKEDEEIQAKNELALISNELKNRIERRLHSHALMLRNGASFFVASDSVTREEWKLFIDHSRIERDLPGIEGVGFTCVIPKEQLQNHIQRVRDEGFPDYMVKPEGDRELYTSILFLEPFSGRNLRAFGYDMYSEPIRRDAMERARDNDMASLSGKVTLVQETGEHPQAGTLMYVPVYQHGMRAYSLEERRKALVGWVYSPYRMDDLMHGILGRWDSTEYNRIRLQIYDFNSPSADSLLFDTQPASYHRDHPWQSSTFHSVPLVFNGKRWTLNFSRYEGVLGFFHGKVLIVFISGVMISFLLFALYLAFSKARSRMAMSESLSSQLKESEEKHRALVENATEGIYVVQNGQVAFANLACEAITGIPFKEMIGLPIKEFLDTEETDKLYQHHDNLIAGTTHSLHEIYPVNNRKNERRWLLINSVQIVWNGTPATLNLATDVTRRKEDEAEISHKNEELENLNATKDKFFSIIAHDLRSPFNSLLGLTEMMVHDLPNLDKEQIQSLVEIIYKSTTNLYRLLENLLQWSQIQNDTIAFNPEAVALRRSVDESIEISREAANLKDIEMVAIVPAHLQVMADPNMLHTIVRNLLSNAIKFTHRGGKVSVVASTTGNDTVQISVKDTGIGISPTMIGNLFRLDVKTNRQGTEGESTSGLGLVLCKEFIEKHGGRIWVDSVVGEGSTFHFTLPGQVEGV
ncbi:MAG TPA: CHASE domain-containing protein [Prolixibacteraceae bacterium]|nr:CHASE domain-containing protein [Prolixibacteraceae bacterium]